MKSCLYCLFFSLLFSYSGYSQNYQPFSKNSYVYWIPYDEYYKLTVDSVTASGNDSIFYFNTIAHYYLSDSLDDKMCESMMQIPDYKLGCENIFGSKMIKSPDDNYFFITTQDTFLIKAQPQLNAKWVFSKKKGITAFVKEIIQEKVMDITDSVLVIQLSTGDIFKLSKNYGLLLGKILLREPYSSFNDEILQHIPDEVLILKSIPSAGLGYKFPEYKDFFDFKVGDEIGYYKTESEFLSSLNYSWENSKIKILEYATDSNNEFKYKYEYKFHKTIADFDKKTLDTVKGKYISNSTINQKDYLFLSVNSLQFTLTDTINAEGVLLTSINRNKFFKLNFQDYFYDSCTNIIGGMFDDVHRSSYTQRLGKTHESTCCSDEALSCYIINNKTDSSGSCYNIDKMLSVEENGVPQPTFQISPNPANNEITLKTTLKNNNQNSKDLIKITDIQGKVVNQQIINSATINQYEEIKIDVSALLNGLYLLHFISGNGSVSSQKFIISR